MLDAAGKLPWRNKLAYALPALATTSLGFMVESYLTDFYVMLVSHCNCTT